jgi:outer membrane protein
MANRIRGVWILVVLSALRLSAQQVGSQEQAAEQAVKLDPTVEAARKLVESAQSRVMELTAGRRLQLSLESSLSMSGGKVAEPPSDEQFRSIETSLVAPLPNIGRSNAEVSQAKAELAAAESQLQRVIADVRFQAEQSFLKLWRAREEVTVATDNLDQAKRQAGDTQKRIDAGDVPPADLLKTDVQVAQNKAALARARIALRLAEEVAEPDLTVAPLPPGDKVVDYALDHSPAVLEAKANLEAAKAGVNVVKRNNDVDLSLQLTHARTSDPTAYAHLTTLSLNFLLPVADGGVLAQQVRQARLDVSRAESELKGVTQQVRLAVQGAVLEIEGKEADVAATAQTADIARQSLEKARQAYAAGLTTTRDVLDAQLIYSQARVEANSAKYDLAVSRARLRQLAGGPVE